MTNDSIIIFINDPVNHYRDPLNYVSVSNASKPVSKEYYACRVSLS
jgi:hypothetical protein